MAYQVHPYHNTVAVAYAHQWAFGRNPAYYDFTKIGGDCTNFASQCIYAGCGIMNGTRDLGWYYYSVNDRAPAWTSVTYLYQFLIRNEGIGPFGQIVEPQAAQPGDIVQIRFVGSSVFNHSPVIVSHDGSGNPEQIFIAAHTYDSDNRALSSYESVAEFRFIHIAGYRTYRNG